MARHITFHPEQIRGKKDITPASDLYGLGATLYHMVTGGVPFPGKNPSEVMHRHLKQTLAPPDHINTSLSAGFSQIIEMMMAKDVNARYQNASDLIEDLETIESGGFTSICTANIGLCNACGRCTIVSFSNSNSALNAGPTGK